MGFNSAFKGLNKTLGVPQCRSGRSVEEWNLLCLQGFEHLIVQLVVLSLLRLHYHNSRSPLLYLFFFPVVLWPNAGHGLLILEVSKSHTTTHHSLYDSSGRVISASQRPLPDKTQHSQQKNIHAPGGIRTHDISRRAAVGLRLRPRGYWDRHRYSTA